MATTVIKRDGTKQAFDEGKLRRSVESASTEAGFNEEKIHEVAGKVLPAVLELASSKDEISTLELKQAILSGLDQAEPLVATAWRKHEESKGA